MLSLFSRNRYPNKEARLFSLTYQRYLDSIKDVSIHLGFSQTPLTTHPMRIGEALHAYSLVKYFKNVAITGKWQSISSLRRYLKNCKGWLMNLSLPPSA